MFRTSARASLHLPIQIQRNRPNTPVEALTIPTFFSQPTAAQLAGLPTLAQVRLRPGLRTLPFAAQGFAGAVTEFLTIGNSQYDSGSVSVTRRFSDGFAFTARLHWSKTIDDSTNEFNTSAVNPRRHAEFRRHQGRAQPSRRSTFRTGSSSRPNYELLLQKQRGNGFLKGVLGGWEIARFLDAVGATHHPQSGVDSNQNFDVAGDRTP